MSWKLPVWAEAGVTMFAGDLTPRSSRSCIARLDPLVLAYALHRKLQGLADLGARPQEKTRALTALRPPSAHKIRR